MERRVSAKALHHRCRTGRLRVWIKNSRRPSATPIVPAARVRRHAVALAHAPFVNALSSPCMAKTCTRPGDTGREAFLFLFERVACQCWARPCASVYSGIAVVPSSGLLSMRAGPCPACLPAPHFLASGRQRLAPGPPLALRPHLQGNVASAVRTLLTTTTSAMRVFCSETLRSRPSLPPLLAVVAVAKSVILPSSPR